MECRMGKHQNTCFYRYFRQPVSINNTITHAFTIPVHVDLPYDFLQRIEGSADQFHTGSIHKRHHRQNEDPVAGEQDH
jgi:hypothetical protein